MKLFRHDPEKRWIPYTIAVCSGVILYLLLTHLKNLGALIGGLFHFISPVVYGLIIAYILDALVVLLEKFPFGKMKRRKAARVLSIILAVLIVLALITLILGTLIPQLVESIGGLISNLNSYVSSLRQMLADTEIEFAGFRLDLSGLLEFSNDLLQRLVQFVQQNWEDILNASVNIGKGVINFVISAILALYFLAAKDNLLRISRETMQLILPAKRYDSVRVFLLRCHKILGRFIVSELVDALIVSIVNYLFMLICGMPYALLISFLVGLFNLLPTFGPIIGGALGAFILLLVNPDYVLWFLIFTVLLQTVDGYIIKPQLFGDSLGISPLWVTVAIVVGGRMFGVPGVLLSIPFAAIVDFVFRDVLTMIRKKKQAKAAEEAVPKDAAPPAEASATKESEPAGEEPHA